MMSSLDWNWILTNCAASLQRVAAGVAAAAVVGTAAGLSRSMLPAWLKRNPLFNFLIEAPKFPPPIAWIPFVILAFGIGELPAIIIVFIGAVSPIFISTWEAAESLPAPMVCSARSMELKGASWLIRFLLPASLPGILTGLRAGISMGWMSVIAAELVSGQSGLGYSIQLHRLNLQYDKMVVDMFFIGLIGWLLFSLMNKLERWLVPWHPKFHSRGELR